MRRGDICCFRRRQIGGLWRCCWNLFLAATLPAAVRRVVLQSLLAAQGQRLPQGGAEDRAASSLLLLS